MIKGATAIIALGLQLQGGAPLSVRAQDQFSDPSAVMKNDTMSFTTAPGWNLLSMPLEQTVMTPEGVFGDDFGEDFYSVYEYGGVLSGYVPADSLELGRGFWLNSVDSRLVTAMGSPEKTTILPLWIDWNIIGNPFKVQFEVCNLRFSDGIETKSIIDAALAGWLVNAVYGYSDGGYFIEESALDIWIGYWISLLQPNISVHYVWRDSSSFSHATEDGQMGSCARTRITASMESDDRIVRTNSIEFGTDMNATAGFDPAFDAPMPPASGILHPLLIGFEGPSEDRSLLLRDVRNRNAERWTLVVASTDTGNVLVSWSSIEMSEPFEFLVRNSASGVVVAESWEGRFEFTHHGASERFFIEKKPPLQEPPILPGGMRSGR